MSILEFECSTAYSCVERYLKNNIDNVWNFFELEKESISIKITDSYDQFKEIFMSNFNFKPNEYTCGFILDNSKKIIVLNYNDYIKKHDDEKDAYLKIILHEYVHVVHSIFCKKNYPCKCIREGIATYLSNQYKIHSIKEIPKEYLLSDNLSYVYYHNITKLLIENLDRSTYLKILKNEIKPDEYLFDIYSKL